MGDTTRDRNKTAMASKHRNDIYADDLAPQVENPAIPAATVVLLRDHPAGRASESRVEALMLHKTSAIAFGGMWVFPGGRVDEGDYLADRDPDVAARNAALRETQEEAGIVVPSDGIVWFAHWTPPPGTPKRFATWFFAVRADSHEVTIDGGEIQNHQWIAPGLALERHAAGEIDLAPPTWVTLYQMSRFPTVDAALARLRAIPPRYYATRVGKRADGARVAMWLGDAGYVEGNADAPGARHRLAMTPGGFVFENSVLDY